MTVLAGRLKQHCPKERQPVGKRALKSAISSRGAAAILPGIGLMIAVELRQTICSSRLEKRAHSKNSQYEKDRHGCTR
jgi:hypothetical protein